MKLFRTSIINLLMATMLFACDEEAQVTQDLVPSVPVESIIQDEFENIQFVVYGNSTHETMVAYNRKVTDGTVLNFEKTSASFPIIMIDNEGNEWDIFGVAVSGSREGQLLTPINSMMGYWFGFASIFPKNTIYGEAESDKIDQGTSSPDWLINKDHVFRATSKDAIPALTLPTYNQLGGKDLVDESLYVSDEELVIVLSTVDEIKVIPYQVLDWHEVINDKLDNKGIVISYCPLTGTSTIWERPGDGDEFKFGVSGLLYNNNLVLYDQQTNSYWSQIKEQAIYGASIGATMPKIRSIEMTWKASKLLNRKRLLLLDNKTGFDRDYSIYPYGDYKTNHDNLSFSLSFEDNRVPNKEKVLAVIVNEKSKIFRFEHFE